MNPRSKLSRSKPPSQPSSSKSPPRLLPSCLEKTWTADEVWALMSQTEKSFSAYQFSDTPEYWNSITPFFPNSNAKNLRNIHLAILKFQNNVTPWKKDEMKTLICSVYENVLDHLDTPEWWGQVAMHLQGRTAFECRMAYNSFYVARMLSQQAKCISLEKWTLEDYMLLMKILSRNLHVDTEDAGKMEIIAGMFVGKKGEEVRHLILKWRPQLLAALEKADRITGSTSAAAQADDGSGGSEQGRDDEICIRPPLGESDEDCEPSTSGRPFSP